MESKEWDEGYLEGEHRAYRALLWQIALKLGDAAEGIFLGILGDLQKERQDVTIFENGEDE